MYCKECGKEISEKAIICPGCGCKNRRYVDTDRNKWIALAFWFFLGALGGHKFYIRNNNAGVAYAACTLLGPLLFGIPNLVLCVLLILDLIHILQGRMDDVELTD